MNKNIYKLLVVSVMSILFVQCGDGGKFTIAKGKVGELTTLTTINDLNNIFKNDSIVKNLSEGNLGANYFQDDDEYLIYEKGGKHLLTIIPQEQLDSTSTIKSIQIYDTRYSTKMGLSLESSFEDINLNNTITKVETSLSSATLFIDDLNVTISLDKEDLGLKNFRTQKISIEQIPGLAKVKTFIVWFN
ncbi:MAG: hypothetical protein P8I51_05345 [Polaribacter sp.]|jgi:hypothetical protein|nr:hypothetical protein [Polaribacter sp.]MDG1954307.1 hypothetical protein [Polaribacter sp.]MDG2074720.1 hypothetical protein [Polaribacter sp.]